MFATWAGARAIEELAEPFDKLLTSLGISEWHSLHSSLRMAMRVNSARSWIKPLGIRVSVLPSSLSVRTVALLSERCRQPNVDELYERYLTDYKDVDPIVSALRADIELRYALGDETKWSQAIESLRSSYRLGAPTSRALFRYLRLRTPLPDKVAREVVDRPLEFPSTLVRLAEARCRQLDATKIMPVGRVALDEGWFTD